MDSDKKLYSGPKRTVVVTMLLSAGFSMAAANLPSVWGQTKSEMDLETLLAKVRKALTPAKNMRIKWIKEGFHPGITAEGVYPRKGRRKRPDGVIEEYNCREQYNCLITEAGSRLEKRYESAGRDGKSMFIYRETFVHDGTETRSLMRRVKGPPYPNTGRIIGISSAKIPSRFKHAFGNNWVWSWVWHETAGLKAYKRLKVRQNRGIFVVEATGEPGGWTKLITIDGNRGYHIIKEESFREDGSKSLVYNCKLKKYPNGTWFIKEREKIRFWTRSGPGRVEEKMTVTRMQFYVPVPTEDTFKLRFPEGTQVTDGTFNYSSASRGDFLVGCLSEPKHTQEDPAVTAILDQYTGKEKTADLNEVFEPARELCVNSVYERKECFIDFDTGRLMSIPVDYNTKGSIDPRKWFEQNGIDGRVEIEPGLTGLWTFNTVVVPVRS
ncbi:MAG: hypothetical protein HWN51_00165, partial [Desulfobacterales bacterium]|nr:hypothetical protein [Desulfobacterales bacterium]